MKLIYFAVFPAMLLIIVNLSLFVSGVISMALSVVGVVLTLTFMFGVLIGAVLS
jgi:hypothetical protein